MASGDRPSPASRARRGDQLGGAPRGAARGVDLVRVVQLDDLDGLEEAGGLRGEAHHQHRAEREVGRDEHADAGRVGEPARATASSRSASKPVVPTTAWTPCVDAARAGCPARRPGVVKSTATSAPAATSAPPGRRPRRSGDVAGATSSRSAAASTGRGRRLGAHPPVRPRARATLDRAGHQRHGRREGRASSSNGPTTASVGGRGEQLGGDRAHVVQGHRVDPRRAPRRRRAARRRPARPCRAGSSASRCPPGRAPAPPRSWPLPRAQLLLGDARARRPSRARRGTARAPRRPCSGVQPA